VVPTGVAPGISMTRRHVHPVVRVTSALVLILAIAAYTWWATGLHPFTAGSYVAVGLPVVALLLVVLVFRPDRSDRNGPSGDARSPEICLRTAYPWILLFVIAIGLEVCGLALGGRSTTVPTLSTVVDHAMAWHVVRFVLFYGWLAFGWAAGFRAAVRYCNVGD